MNDEKILQKSDYGGAISINESDPQIKCNISFGVTLPLVDKYGKDCYFKWNIDEDQNISSMEELMGMATDITTGLASVITSKMTEQNIDMIMAKKEELNEKWKKK